MRALTLLALWLALLAGAPAQAAGQRHKQMVTATAYNSVRGQTDRTPLHGAWGDRLGALPAGTHAVAVSPDLLRKGLKRGQRLRIKGQPGVYVVLDRTAKRWKNRIDIHMGKDVRAAKRWGRRRVEISWVTNDHHGKLHKKGSGKRKRRR